MKYKLTIGEKYMLNNCGSMHESELIGSLSNDENDSVYLVLKYINPISKKYTYVSSNPECDIFKGNKKHTVTLIGTAFSGTIKGLKNKLTPKFKEIKDKESYIKKHSLFSPAPELTDIQHCVHCGKDFIVGDYKVKVVYDNDENKKMEFIVCPNAPECDGDMTDWVDEGGFGNKNKKVNATV